MDSAAKRLKKWVETNDFYAGCRGQEQLLELNFVRNRAVEVANALAELLKMAETNVISKLPTEGVQLAKEDEWISLTQAAAILGVSKSTVSRWAKKSKLRDNGQKGRKRKVSKTSVLLVKQEREDEDLAADVLDLRADARRF